MIQVSQTQTSEQYWSKKKQIIGFPCCDVMDLDIPSTLCWVCEEGKAYVLGTPEMTAMHPYYKKNTSQARQQFSHLPEDDSFAFYP